MQGNPFDERFMDEAWSAMHQVLDKEMPQKKKRRPFFWWWLLPGILLLLGVLWIYSNQKINQTPILSTKENQSFTNKNNPIDHNSTKTPSQNTVESPLLTDSLKKASGPASIQHNTYKDLIYPIQVDPMNPLIPQPEVPTGPSVVPFPAGEEKDAIQELPVAGRLLMSPIPNLKRLSASPVQYDFLDAFELEKFNHFKTSTKGRWQLALNPQLGLRGNQLIQPSYGFGVSGSFHLKRWYLLSGIYWNQFQDQMNLSGGDEALQSDAGTAVDQENQGPTFGTSSPEPEPEPITALPSDLSISVQQIGFPLHVGFQISNRWQIEGGVQISYVNQFESLLVNEENNASPINRAFDPNFNATNFSTGSNFQFSDALSSRWMVQPQMALFYGIGKKGKLGLQYRWATGDLLNVDTYDWSNQAFQLSFRYRLK